MKRLAAHTISLAALIAGMAGGAAAQDASSTTDAMSLEEVVVTARRREERLQDVPISVTAISGEQLEKRGVTKLEDLQNAVAGVRIEAQNNKSSTPQITIRGMRMYGILGAQDAPTAFYFADAVALPVYGLNGALYDLQSVQVLKGPQGTLFGRNTTGGAVVITPAKPTDAMEGSLTITGGNYSMHGYKGFINVPLSDQLQVRLAGFFNKHGPYYHYTGNASVAGKGVYADEVQDFRPSIVWKPTENIESYTVAYFTRLKGTNIPTVPVGLNPLGGAARYNGTGIYAGLPTIASQIYSGEGKPKFYSMLPQADSTTVKGGVNTTTFDTGMGVTVKNIVSYRDAKNWSFISISGAGLPVLDTFQEMRTKTFTEEFQLSGNTWNNRINWVAGLYYLQIKSLEEQNAAALYFPALATNVAGYYPRSNNKSYAAYVQATAKITDKLAFTAGFRQTKDERNINYMHQTFDRYAIVGIPFAARCLVNSDAGPLLPLSACSVTASASFKEPTYNLSLDYHITPDTLLYVTRRTGYRAGGFNQRGFTQPQRVPFNPERELDHEIGVKSDFYLGEMAMRLNAAYYYDKYKDLQKNINQITAAGLSTSSTFNAASGIVEGVELEFQIKPVRELTFGATYAYTKTKYTSFPYLLAGVTHDFSDREFSGIPKNTYNIYASYDFPIDPEMGEVTLSADYSYQGSSFISDLYQNAQQLSILYPAAMV